MGQASGMEANGATMARRCRGDAGVVADAGICKPDGHGRGFPEAPTTCPHLWTLGEPCKRRMQAKQGGRQIFKDETNSRRLYIRLMSHTGYHKKGVAEKTVSVKTLLFDRPP